MICKMQLYAYFLYPLFIDEKRCSVCNIKMTRRLMQSRVCKKIKLYILS
ncbi:MAG: hypothetical protein AVDCRST_MAG96-1551 [uncultured Segetibacter sp.]|uniref:Uncharacterized protein n=1 Tax=uncultured Segetibacter sp. TaxID=481133 RepID=A0A6J4S8Z5_9BACT|nr:MAG: hypothetical protein AVDCRST_MAG96-1551 [uncultured Segetibacter sp.]